LRVVSIFYMDGLKSRWYCVSPVKFLYKINILCNWTQVSLVKLYQNTMIYDHKLYIPL